MYEPLKIIPGGCQKITKDERIELLDNFMNCNFPDFDKEEINKVGSNLDGNFIFRYKTKRLCKVSRLLKVSLIIDTKTFIKTRKRHLINLRALKKST